MASHVRAFSRCAAAVVATSLGLACSGGTDAGPQPDRIVVSPDSMVLGQLASEQISTVVLDADGEELSGAHVVFVSDDETVVTVTEGGLVRSVGAPGTAAVTARAGRAQAVIAVEVRQTPGEIVAPSTVSLPQLTTLVVQATVEDAIGTNIPGAVVAYESQDPNLFTVDASGQIRSLGRAGHGTLWIRHGGLSKPVGVTITPVPTAIASITPSLILPVGGEAQSVVRVSDAIGDLISDPSLSFVSANPGVASVGASGLVRGAAVGATSITAGVGGLSTTVAVEVASITRPSGLDVRAYTAPSTSWGVDVAANGLALIASPTHGAYRVDLETGALHRVRDQRELPTVTGFTPSGSRGFVGSQANLDIIDFAADTVVGSLPYADVLGIATSPDGRTLVLGTGGTHLMLLDAATHALRATAATGNVNAIAFTPNGARLFATNAVGAPRVLEVDVSTGDVLRIISIDDAQGIGLAPDGSELYVARERVAHLLVIPLPGGTHSTIPVPAPCFGLAVTPDGQEIWAVCENAVQIIDRVSKAIVRSIPIAATGRRIAFTRNGRTAVVTSDAGYIYVIQ